jgi:ribosome-associated translation inhibitor RaiA
MKIMIKHVGVRADAALDASIEKHLFAVANEVTIDAANVVVERRWDGGAAFRVAVHLETPGPDVQAEGADQTLNAAVLKCGRQLRKQVKSRAARRLGRVKTNLQAPSLGRQGVRR